MSSARIVRVQGDDLLDVHLEVADGYRFKAGQYLLAGASSVALSIASPPRAVPEVRLLFRSDGGDAAEMFRAELTGDTLPLSDAAGDVTPDPNTSMTLICAGTGIAQALSLLGQRDPQLAQPSSLFWARLGDEPVEISAQRDLAIWQTTDPTLGPDNALQRQLTTQANHLAGQHIVLCGSPGFVYQCVDTLEASGIDPTQMQSDVFAYAPR